MPWWSSSRRRRAPSPVSYTHLELSVAADDDYQIESIVIDGTQEDIADTASFTKKLTVDKDTTIAVKFIRVYTVTVTYDSQHGTVETCLLYTSHL